MTLSVIDTQSETFRSQNITTFPDTPQRREGGGEIVTRVGGNKELMSTSHFLRNSNANNQNAEIGQFRNRKTRQKSGKTVNNKHSVFDMSQFHNKWLSNITDSIHLFNSIFGQQIFDSSDYGNLGSASPFFQTSNKNDEPVGRMKPAAKLINSQGEHDNNDDEVNAFLAQKQKLAKVIFFSFATLHEFLTDADQNLSKGSSTTFLQNEGENIKYKTGHGKIKNLMLNSRIISASIDEKSLRRRTNKKYFYNTEENESMSPPVVNIDFTHLHKQMSDPICVYWNSDKEAWSDNGCYVVSSNEEVTRCQCQHLTHFALLMRFPEDMDIQSIGSGIIFDNGVSDVYAKKNEDSTSSTVITLEIATYIISTVCLIILILLIVHVRKTSFLIPQFKYDRH